MGFNSVFKGLILHIPVGRFMVKICAVNKIMVLAAYAIQKSCFGVSGVLGRSTPDTQTEYYIYIHIHTVLLLLLLLLFSRLYNVSTSSCAHLTIILSSSSICLCHSSLLPLIPFPPSVL